MSTPEKCHTFIGEKKGMSKLEFGFVPLSPVSVPCNARCSVDVFKIIVYQKLTYRRVNGKSAPF